MVGTMATAREMLLAERARVRQRIAALEREFAGIAEAASAGGTDDEHDPEGATLAFERQHTAALLEQAREQLGANGAGSQSGMTDWRPARRRGPVSAVLSCRAALYRFVTPLAARTRCGSWPPSPPGRALRPRR
jgi:hypothetical protein